MEKPVKVRRRAGCVGRGVNSTPPSRDGLPRGLPMDDPHLIADTIINSILHTSNCQS
jgi:hypothetical protein